MKKKIMAFVLAGTMLVGGSMTVSASAIDAPGDKGLYSQEVTVTNKVTTPTIKVTVPTSAEVALNPYKIKTTVGNNSDATTAIVSDTYIIKNESNVPIRCDASLEVKGADNSEIALATAALKGTETTKSVFIYLDVQEASSDSDTITVEDFDTKSTAQLIGGKLTTKKGLITLAAKDTDPTYAKYSFGGSCAPLPAKAWTADDKISVALTWIFTPVLPE